MEKSDFTIDELSACARREVAYRKRVYARLVLEDKMNPEQAGREIAMMEAIVALIEDQQQLRLFPVPE